MWLCTFLLALLVSKGRIATRTKSDNNAPLDEFMSAFIYLLNLTDVTCDGFDWCTVHKKNVEIYRTTTVFYHGGCCSRCSCEPTCMAKMNCCPDYKLKPFIDGVYTNISQLRSAIEDIPDIERLDIRLHYGNATLQTNNTLPTKCVSSDMNKQTSINSHKGSMYRMVSTCIDQNVSLDSISKCEFNGSNLSGATLDDIRPVQSLDSGVVYRNKHCLYCSEEVNSSYEKWDVYVSDTHIPMRIFESVSISYGELIEWSFFRESTRSTSSMINLNVLFEPSDIIRAQHPPQYCIDTVVDSCSSETHADRTLACRQFYLPLYRWDSVRRRHIPYNNVACLSCNAFKLNGWRSVCASYSHEPKYLFLGKLKNELLVDLEADGPQSGRDGRLEKDASPLQCQKGFIYDIARRSCRQLYCPCGMVQHKSKCTPIFQTIAGKDVEFYVTVTRQRHPAINLTDAEYVNAIVDYFDHQFESDEYVYTGALLVGRLDEKLQTQEQEHAAYVMLKKREFGFDFFSVVRKIGKAAQGIRQIPVRKHSVSVELTVVDSIIIGHWDVLADHAKQKHYITVYTRRSDADMSNGILLLVRSCFFCYRVELRNDEFSVKTSSVLFLTNRRTHFSAKSMTHFITNRTRHLLCSNELIPQMSLSAVEETDMGTDVYISIVPMIDEFADKYSFLVASCVITLVLIVSCLVKRAWKRRLLTENALQRGNETSN